jgi:translation initiation factor 2B subunit (eIF-2B alpha/beta/delta family)
MPERRFDHARELEALGLAPPDDETMHFLWQIVDEGVLGASRHVELGNQLILHLIGTGPEGVDRARRAAAFIARTRGYDTPVIGNSLDLLLAGIEALPADEQGATLRARIDDWSKAAASRKSALVEAGVRHLSQARGIMAFDYSSTVAAIVIALVKTSPDLLVVVPESRAIAGGARYVEEFLSATLNVRFIPDAAIEHGLAVCDAALFGVETLRADGSFLNTIGSRMIARLAGPMGVETYGATDLMKLDRRSYGGHRPEPAIRAYDDVLKAGLEIPSIQNVDTSAPELEVIPPNLTTGLITEYGVVPPAAIWMLGRETFSLRERS